MSQINSESLYCQVNQSKAKKSYSYQKMESCGKWKQEQMLKYIIFIEYYKETLSSKAKRRQFKAFKLMSELVQTRNAIQCRSHHQKLLDKYRIIGKIISHFKGQFDKSAYKQRSQKLINSNPKIFFKPMFFAESDAKKEPSTAQVAIQTDWKGDQIVRKCDIHVPFFPHPYLIHQNLNWGFPCNRD